MDCVSREAMAPPAKLDMAEAAEAVGASLCAGSEAHVLVISSVVRYIYMNMWIHSRTRSKRSAAAHKLRQSAATLCLRC